MTGEPALDAVARARRAVLSEFGWSGGHADVWRIFRSAAALAAVVEGLADPWRKEGITHVAGVEARGFLLAGAVAVSIGAGFQAVRKAGGLLPGTKLAVTTQEDYRGIRHQLRMQDTLGAGDVVLLVDDWAERGSQALAVRRLIEVSGARFAGVSLVVDQLEDGVRAELGRVSSLLRARELGRPPE